MARLFSDSFDHYTTLSHKGWTTSSGPTIGANGRFGTNGVNCHNNFAYIRRSITQGDVFIANIAFRINTLPTAGAYAILAGFYEGANAQVYVCLDSNGYIIVQRLSSDIVVSGGGLTWTVLGTSASTYSAGVYRTLEVKVEIGNSGSAVVKVNGTTILTLLSVDTQATANAYANGFIAGNPNNSSTLDIDFDDLIIMDDAGSFMNDFIGDKRVIASFATAEGNYSDFTPSTGVNNAALVDETAPNDDSDYVSSPNPGDKDTYTQGGISQTVANINAIVLNHRARKDDAGTREIQALIRSNSVDDNGPTHALSSSYEYYQSEFYQNPDGDVDWTPTTINALEVGQEVIS